MVGVEVSTKNVQLYFAPPKQLLAWVRAKSSRRFASSEEVQKRLKSIGKEK